MNRHSRNYIKDLDPLVQPDDAFECANGLFVGTVVGLLIWGLIFFAVWVIL